MEALAAVRSDYRIDPTRIYLHGYCSTGLFSLMELRRHPGRYAAVAMVNPVLRRLKGRFDERREFRASAAYRAWLQETDPVEQFGELPNIPYQILHDELDPDHGPLAHSVELVNKLRATGNAVTFTYYRSPAPRPIRERLVWEQLAWLCQQRSENPSDAPATTISSAPRSAADILSERFVVVRGMGGEEAEREAAARWTSEFCDAWERTSFVPCRIVDDVSLTEEDARLSNLVLIGAPTTNAVWKRLAPQLPIQLSPNRVEILGRVHTGTALGVQAAFSNPEQLERKLLLIGSANPEAVFGTQELAIDGWFRYAIWAPTATAPQLLAAER